MSLFSMLGARLAEAEAHPGAALHAREHHEQADQQQQRQHVDQQFAQNAALVDDGADLGVLSCECVEQVDRVPGREFGDDLVRILGVVVALFQGQPQLLLAVVDLRALDVVAVDLGHRHRGVDGLKAAGVVAEVKERPAQQHHHSDRRDGADHVFPVHQSSAARPGPSPITRRWKCPGYRPAAIASSGGAGGQRVASAGGAGPAEITSRSSHACSQGCVGQSIHS